MDAEISVSFAETHSCHIFSQLYNVAAIRCYRPVLIGTEQRYPVLQVLYVTCMFCCSVRLCMVTAAVSLAMFQCSPVYGYTLPFSVRLCMVSSAVF